MSGVVLRLRSKCPQGQLGDIDLASSDSGATEGPEASLFCIGGVAIVQDTLSVTSWSFRAEGADSVMCKAFLRGYKLQVVTMQRHMIVDVDALAETRVFDKPVLLERGIPITVRLVPKDEKMIAQCTRDYLNAPGNPLSEIRFVFEMSGSVIDRVNP